jgi:hypothetical protein
MKQILAFVVILLATLYMVNGMPAVPLSPRDISTATKGLPPQPQTKGLPPPSYFAH